MYGATLTLLRARIAERLRIFDVYVIHDRHRHHHHHLHHLHHIHHLHHLHHLHHHPLWRYVDAIIRFSIFATGGKDVLIPYEDMLMLLSDSAYLPQGVKDVLIPYEDMQIQHICHRGEGCFDPLWRYVDATFRFSIFATGGEGCFDPLWRYVDASFILSRFVKGGGVFFAPLWRQVDVITPFSIFVGGGGGFFIPYEDRLTLFLIQHICQRGWRMLISYEDKWVWLPHLTYLL